MTAHPRLTQKRILLAVTGGIAAYKSAELCRRLIQAGADVHCLMTPSATKLVGPMTFEALSGHPVGLDLFQPSQPGRIEHITLAEQAHLVIVAPATADFLARYAHGHAGDVIGATLLATTAPVLIAPGMNVNMWDHPATQENLATLRRRGVLVVGPGVGELACRTHGAGRMAEPDEIVEAAGAALTPKDLAGRHVLVTAGATREALDPVRFLSNRATGRMGFAVARAAADRGARVTLVAGPGTLPDPAGVTCVRVESAEEMAGAVLSHAAGADVVIKAAAVADWRPARRAATKLKKTAAGEALTLELARTTDILRALGERRGAARRPVLVGFAAETGDPVPEARRKLADKGCDLVVANDVTAPDAGFGVETNQVTLVRAGCDPEALPLMTKLEVAHRVLDAVAALLDAEELTP
jgi:phosphopantothenoylcysteine decarboxylase/phosphopantothenate--cysteine ligase